MPSLIPSLSIAAEPARGPGLADNVDDGVQVWRDADGAPFAYCGIVNGLHLIDMPGVARFSFQPTSGDVRAFPYSSRGSDLLHDAYRRNALPMILQARGTEVLHASAVSTKEGIVGFCGESGTGKSTVAVAFSHRAYAVWADDAVALDPSGASALAIPVPFRVRLRPLAAQFFYRESQGPGIAEDEMRADPPWRQPERLAAICVLQRVSEVQCGEVVERLPSRSAFSVLLSHAFCFSLQDSQCKRRMTAHYLRIVERVPCFAIRFRAGLRGLPAILDAIEREVMGS